MAIYGIGLPRCGGQSLCQALTILCGSCTHSPGNQPIRTAAAVEVFRDPLLILGEDPNARFIYNDRCLEAWLKSCERVYHKSGDWNHPIWKYPLRDFELYRDNYARYMYEQSIWLDNVLWWDLTKDPDWSILCDFLDMPVPDVPFPHFDVAGQ